MWTRVAETVPEHNTAVLGWFSDARGYYSPYNVVYYDAEADEWREANSRVDRVASPDYWRHLQPVAESGEWGDPAGDKFQYIRGDWKYQLTNTYSYTYHSKALRKALPYIISDHIDTDMNHCIDTRWYRIVDYTAFICVIGKTGYCWDGPSGPTFDTAATIRASLIHDILYQAMAEGLISIKFRRIADLIFLSILREDGMGLVSKVSVV